MKNTLQQSEEAGAVAACEIEMTERAEAGDERAIDFLQFNPILAAVFQFANERKQS